MHLLPFQKTVFLLVEAIATLFIKPRETQSFFDTYFKDISIGYTALGDKSIWYNATEK